jgi:hypothetical protein
VNSDQLDGSPEKIFSASSTKSTHNPSKLRIGWERRGFVCKPLHFCSCLAPQMVYSMSFEAKRSANTTPMLEGVRAYVES